MKITISILTYNRAHILRELLESLKKIMYSPLEIIVVDNNSTDKTEKVLRTEFPGVKYIKMKENLGVEGRNEGIKCATGDIIITLDDDVIGIGDRDIEVIRKIFDKKPNIGAICFRIVDYSSGEVCNWCHHFKKEEYYDKEFITDEITEGAVAFRKSALEKAGYYPTFFFISYEGPDLMCRMLDRGYLTMYSPKICVKHRTAPEGRKSWRRYYYDTRNQIWFVARNYPVFWGLMYLARGIPAMFIYSMRDGFVPYWYKGIRDGIKALPNVIHDRKKVSKETFMIIREIAYHRPSLVYTIKERLLRREIRL